MKTTNEKKNKHMTITDRQEIESGLKKGLTFKTIAGIVKKDPTTISKEVKKHFEVKPTTVVYPDPACKVCPKLLKAPFVCNGCPQKYRDCGHDKKFYRAVRADNEYKEVLVESREGIPLNKESFYEFDKELYNRVEAGQHIYHILADLDFPVSKSTVYRHLHKGYLSISKTSLPRVVKFKPRKQSPKPNIPKGLKVGRTYLDFKNLIEEEGIQNWVEMDTVIGSIGGKVILTFDFTFCNFMFAKLLDDKTAASVSTAIQGLKEDFNEQNKQFGKLFPIILTDNGSEFANVFAIENDENGNKETDLFFCDAYHSSQKPRVEKNHTLYRDIVPKGESFDTFTQETIDLIFSHINSVKRKNLNGKTAFEVFSFTYGTEIAALLGVKEIPSSEVCQSPKLLKNNLEK